MEDLTFNKRRQSGKTHYKAPFTSEVDTFWEWQYMGPRLLPGYEKEFYGYEYFMGQ